MLLSTRRPVTPRWVAWRRHSDYFRPPQTTGRKQRGWQQSRRRHPLHSPSSLGVSPSPKPRTNLRRGATFPSASSRSRLRRPQASPCSQGQGCPGAPGTRRSEDRRPLVGAELATARQAVDDAHRESTRSPPRAGRLRTQAARKSSRRRVRGHPRRGSRFSRSSAAGPICASSCWKRRRTLPSARSPLAWRVSAGFARNSLDAGCRKRSLSRRSGGNRSSANTKPSQPSRARTRTWQDNTRARVRFSIDSTPFSAMSSSSSVQLRISKRCNGASCAIGGLGRRMRPAC